MKPCEASCPKCGSSDIHRQFNAKGAEVRSLRYGVRPNEHVAGCGTYSWTSQKDHIHNHCRSCQYAWATMPLKTDSRKGKGGKVNHG